MPSPTPDPQPQAFDLLALGVQRQLYRMGWRDLRAVQADAIRAFTQTDQDLLIMAETAGGKTEAAFLPVLSAVSHEPTGSIRAIYVGPLKALINDQFGRLEELCSYLDLKVHRWHGDVSRSHKEALVKAPSGVLLITPESLESLLINRTAHLAALVGGLRAVVVDEVHAFLEGERGLHLASLLARLRRYVKGGQPPPRMLGLSATVGDPVAAQRYLSPDAPERVTVLSDVGGKEIQFRIHGYLRADVDGDEREDTGQTDEATLRVMKRIATDLVEHCRSHSNLVFANAKGDIELYADMANEVCRGEGLPETFLVHHGSLAKEVREDAEAIMKGGGGRPMTTVCSSTLEMGIDIGSVRMVGQIGAPWSVASFKQRLGRGGRKENEPRRLRGYVICDQTNGSDPLSQMPLDLLQTIAICELMLKKWVEPPEPALLDLSTLTHQLISSIAELGAAEAAELYTRLCRAGPFRSVPTAIFVQLLRELGAAEVLEQGPDGKLILGLIGEQLRAHRDFYAAFASRAEYTVIAGDRVLGTLPIDTVPKPGEHIVFAARRWQVADVDAIKLVLMVVPAKRRQRPKFMGGLGDVHPRVRGEMLAVLASDSVPVYLDPVAAEVLAQARRVARAHDLSRRRIMSLGDNRCVWLTWTGTKRQRTLLALLAESGIDALDKEIAIECRVSEPALRERLATARELLGHSMRLARHVQPKQVRKYDHLLSEALLDQAIASDRLDRSGAESVWSSTER